ncbi:MAG TPA: hypothetical protein VFX84_02050 [Candidatus Saccharimonadales bacterium]|nr:hypothetical protein [Candidatus Saccharimonadales bacterium]
MSKSEPKSKKKSDSSKPAPVTDVAHPNTSVPSDTSKPIITHRPMIKDPMMVEGKVQSETEPEEAKLPIRKTGEAKLKPLDEKPDDGDAKTGEDKKGEDKKPEHPDKTVADAASEEVSDDGADRAEPETPDDGDADDSDTVSDTAEDAEATKDEKTDDGGDGESGKSGKAGAGAKPKADAEAEEDPKIRKLVESKRYFLPINAVEHRRSARFATMGVILALILAAAWVNIALDAGLIHIDGVKPVTHLFSN